MRGGRCRGGTGTKMTRTGPGVKERLELDAKEEGRG